MQKRFQVKSYCGHLQGGNTSSLWYNTADSGLNSSALVFWSYEEHWVVHLQPDLMMIHMSFALLPAFRVNNRRPFGTVTLPVFWYNKWCLLSFRGKSHLSAECTTTVPPLRSLVLRIYQINIAGKEKLGNFKTEARSVMANGDMSNPSTNPSEMPLVALGLGEHLSPTLG